MRFYCKNYSPKKTSSKLCLLKGLSTIFHLSFLEILTSINASVLGFHKCLSFALWLFCSVIAKLQTGYSKSGSLFGLTYLLIKALPFDVNAFNLFLQSHDVLVQHLDFSLVIEANSWESVREKSCWAPKLIIAKLNQT